MNKKRMASFFVPEEEFTSDRFVTMVSRLHLVPVRVEFLYQSFGFEYTAVSSYFDVVPDGMRPPHIEMDKLYEMAEVDD